MISDADRVYVRDALARFTASRVNALEFVLQEAAALRPSGYRWQPFEIEDVFFRAYRARSGGSDSFGAAVDAVDATLLYVLDQRRRVGK